MHIAQLFCTLFLAETNEIVEAGLPDVSYGDGRSAKRAGRGSGLGAKLAQQPIGKILFQSGQGQRRISALRLGEEKMDMLGHDYVTDNHKAMALPDLLHDFKEEVAGARRAEKGLKAACSDEVGVSRAVEAVKICRHAKGATGGRRFGCDE